MAKLIKAVMLRDYELDGQHILAGTVIEKTAETVQTLLDFGLVDTNKAAIENANN